jgi:Mlc titration factor MtfA (ptsG expression regulator)
LIWQWLDWTGAARRKRLQLLSQKAGDVLPQLRQWNGMGSKERDKLLRWVAEFCEQKNWEGCKGLQLTDAMKFLIAGNAGLLVLGWEETFLFPDVQSVLVYPDHFVAPHRTSIGSGLHLESQTALEGQAWHRGPVIISWSDVVEPNRGTPHNLVVHEFAHQLDMFNGGNADGMPPLPEANERRWNKVNRRAMEQLQHMCSTGQYSVLDCYGCEHPAEFFAVSSEAYFEAPDELSAEFPELFEQLTMFYRSDPRQWF